MKTYLFFISNEDAKDGNKTGFAYAKSKKSSWIEQSFSISDVDCVYVEGINNGQDYIVKHDVVYTPYKKYVNITENYILIICKTSELGCETKVF